MSQAVGNTALAYARVWHHVDASERTLGKLAERVALVLMGKHKPIYDPGADCGDYVVLTNARGVHVTGRKAEQIVYRKHSMFPGGLKETPYKVMQEKKPDEIIRHAVSGMLPKNKLRERRLARLRIFDGPDAGSFAQNVLRTAPQALADASTPRVKKTRGVEPALLSEWHEIAKEQKWEVPASIVALQSAPAPVTDSAAAA